MSAQIIPFPTTWVRVCRYINGKLTYRMFAGMNPPPGWSLVMRRVDVTKHKGWVA